MKYWDCKRLLDRGCDYSFVVSGRGPGKTTSVTKKLIDDFVDHQAQFVRIVRYDWACPASIMERWFNDVAIKHLQSKMGLEDAYITFKHMEYRLHPEGNDNYVVMGYVVPLNNQDDYKSVAYDYVEWVVMEEFAALRERDYIDCEIDLFLSALSTIVRSRHNVRCIFIGNTLTKHNPYFDWLGIDMENTHLEPGEIKAYRCAGFEGMGATVAIEMAEMSYEAVAEISPLMRVSGNEIAIESAYASHPSVSDYGKLTNGTIASDYDDGLPFGIYVGNGQFARCFITKKPYINGQRLIKFETANPSINDMLALQWLNVSEEFRPSFTISSHTGYVNVIAKNLLTDDQRKRLKDSLDACIVVYENDNIRYMWERFLWAS